MGECHREGVAMHIGTWEDAGDCPECGDLTLQWRQRGDQVEIYCEKCKYLGNFGVGAAIMAFRVWGGIPKGLEPQGA